MREFELTGILRYSDGHWCLVRIERRTGTPEHLIGTSAYIQAPKPWEPELRRFENKKVTVTGRQSDTALGTLVDVRRIRVTK